MKQVTKNSFIYWTKVVVLGVILGTGLQFAQAWTEPGAAPPGGNVEGPLTVGPQGQWKEGNLILNTNGIAQNGLLIANGKTGLGTIYPHPKTGVHVFNRDSSNGAAELFIDTIANRGSSIVYGHEGKMQMYAGINKAGDRFGIGPIIDSDTGAGSAFHLSVNKNSGQVTLGLEGRDPHPKASVQIFDNNDSSGANGLFIDTIANRGSNIVYGHEGKMQMYAGINKAGDTFGIGPIIDSDTGAGSAFHLSVNKNSGRVGIGLSNPSYPLDVNGQVRANNVSVSSDERLKHDITPLSGSLSKILGLRGVSYFWNDTELSQEKQIGLIAQEVEKEFPELVSTDNEGMKSVNYASMVAPLIEAVKEQQEQIENLTDKNNDFQQQIDDLRALLEKK